MILSRDKKFENRQELRDGCKALVELIRLECECINDNRWYSFNNYVDYMYDYEEVSLHNLDDLKDWKLKDVYDKLLDKYQQIHSKEKIIHELILGARGSHTCHCSDDEYHRRCKDCLIAPRDNYNKCEICYDNAEYDLLYDKYIRKGEYTLGDNEAFYYSGDEEAAYYIKRDGFDIGTYYKKNLTSIQKKCKSLQPPERKYKYVPKCEWADNEPCLYLIEYEKDHSFTPKCGDCIYLTHLKTKRKMDQEIIDVEERITKLREKIKENERRKIEVLAAKELQEKKEKEERKKYNVFLTKCIYGLLIVLFCALVLPSVFLKRQKYLRELEEKKFEKYGQEIIEVDNNKEVECFIIEDDGTYLDFDYNKNYERSQTDNDIFCFGGVSVKNIYEDLKKGKWEHGYSSEFVNGKRYKTVIEDDYIGNKAGFMTLIDYYYWYSVNFAAEREMITRGKYLDKYIDSVNGNTLMNDCINRALDTMYGWRDKKLKIHVVDEIDGMDMGTLMNVGYWLSFDKVPDYIDNSWGDLLESLCADYYSNLAKATIIYNDRSFKNGYDYEVVGGPIGLMLGNRGDGSGYRKEDLEIINPDKLAERFMYWWNLFEGCSET